MKSTASRLTIGIALIIAIGTVAPVSAEWNKGLEAYKAKDWATAAKEFEEVTKTNPDYAGAYYMLGLSQRAAGNLSPALASLRKAVELDPTSVYLKRELAVEYMREQYLRASMSVQSDVNAETWRLFELTVIDGESCEAAAKIIGKSVGTVYAARSRVMRRLRDHIQRLEQSES